MANIDGRALKIDDSVRAATEEHCFSRVDVEVGGFLLGNITDSEVSVTASQPARTAESGQTQLTFTHEAWDEVLGKMETDFAGLEIVGWYHSHPGFGCFLSDYDIFIQENFFASPGQHALVIDPIAGEDGVFTASKGTAHTITTGTTTLSALSENLEGQSGNEARAALVEQQLSQIATRNPRATLAKTLGVVTLLIFSLGLGWFIGNLQGRDAERTTANTQVQALEDQLIATEELLAAAESTQMQPEEPSDSATPTATPEPDTTQVQPAPGTKTNVEVEYQVRRGDNLWLIAERFLGDGNEYRKLIKWNPQVKETGLIPGEKILLRVPATVVSGGE